MQGLTEKELKGEFVVSDLKPLKCWTAQQSIAVFIRLRPSEVIAQTIDQNLYKKQVKECQVNTVKKTNHVKRCGLA